MTTPLTIEATFQVRRRTRGRKELQPGASARETPALPSGRVPRVARSMALAIRLDRLIGAGEVASYADLARLGHVTRARVTQILNLLYLAPDIQEAILFLPLTERGRDRYILRELLPIAAEFDWNQQRRLWRELITKRSRSRALR